MAINYTQILEDRSSFQLVRTNPKLTGNVKFTVNGNDKMWLNSINANPELSKELYKKVAIDPTTSLPGNIFKFFNNGSTPNELIYEMNESFDSTKTSSDFKDQYDFSHYFSGAKYLVNTRYDEKITYFAPLYLKKDVPEYFVIFKVNDPINRPISELKADYPYDREKYIKELFQKASLIKTFDLRNTTTVGKYIRDYIEDDNFPTSPLTVSYEEDSITSWNGILLDTGVMGTRGELLNDMYRQSLPLKDFEEKITTGYERNGVIIPNILNMEFIFDDDTSELYDFNRYIGFYVNAVELSKMEVDLGRGYDERGSWENTPVFRRKYQESETINLDQHNDNGVIIPVDNIDIYLSEFKNIFSDKDNMFFNYITDKNNKLYTPKLIDPFDIDYDVITGNERKRAKIRLSNTDIKLSDFYGPSEVFLQDKGVSSKVGGYSYAYIKIDKLSHLDEITVYHPNGTRINSNGRYDLLTGVTGYSLVPDEGDFYVFNDYDKSVGYDIFYFNIDGSPSDVVKAINGCLTGIRNSRFRVYSANEFCFIKLNIPNDVDETYRLEFNSPSGNYTRTIGTLIDVPRITINDVAGQDLINTISDFEGGSTSTRNRLIIDSGHYDKIKNNINDLLVKTSSGWSKISKISRYIDTVTETNVSTPSGRSSVIEDFLGNIAIILELDIDAKVEYGNFMIRRKHKPAFGLLSFMHIKDFDFDFYSSEYLNFPEIDLHKTYFIPPNATLLEEGKTYDVRGKGTIKFNSSFINTDTTFTVPVGQDLFYTIESGDPFVVITKDFTWRFDDNNFDSGPGAGSLKFVSFLNNKHSFSVGDQVTVIQDPGATNPGYDGPATITHITSDYEVKINKSFGLSTPAEGGIIIKTNSSGKFNAIHDENDEYKNFEGFFTLKDPSLVISDDGSDTYAFKTKYINGIAKSEYDYFKENNNIDFSLRSKILPYINKWVSTDGTDSRSNPYRLNGELMFGFNNFSPDHNDRSQNSGNFTHEWFYIESKFNYADAPETMLKNNSYFDTKFNLDRALSEEGYFTDYFTYTPSFDISGNGVEEIGETQIRYSPINRNKLGVYESLFKGFKIQFKDYIDANTIDGSGKPEPDISSNRFEDYKFSCILIPKKEVTSRTLSTPVDPPIKYRMIEQNNFKFMLLIIEVSLGSFDQINSYWDSTADTVNKANYNDLSIIPGGATMPYSTINGDYRIKFDDTTGISDLDYTSIYSLKHKKYNNIENNFSTIKLSSNLNLNKQPTTGAFFNGGNLIPNVILNDIRNYPSKVSDEIHFPDTSNFIIAEDLTSGSILFMDQFDISPSVLAVFNESRLISSTNSAVIMSERLNFKLIKDDGTIVSTVPNSTSSVTYRDDYEFRILSGGEVYHQSLFEKLSFATFKEYVNTLDPFIEYESYNYDLDTSTLITNTVNWFVEIPDTSFITKETHLLTKSDSNKPTNAEANADVGFTYLSVDLDNSYELNRYDGGFSPLFKNIFTFNSKYKFNVQSTRITVKSILDSGLTIDFETGTDTILVSSTTYTSLDTLAEALSIAINSNINQYATAIWDSGNSYLDITPTVDSTILVLSNLINVSQSEIVNGNGFKYLDQSNTKFNINIDKFMKLNNFNHIKIANNKILDLESDSKGFKPVYELINEIAIGRADYDLLSSNWDYGFHHQYTDKSTKTPKPGTLRIEEDDSFVSKLVMLRDNIELELIDSDTVKYNIVSVPNLSNINIDDFDLVYTEESSKIKGKLNLGNIITKYLLNDGFATKFNEFLIKDTADSLLLKSSSEYIGNFKSIEEYIKEYIKLNVLKLYEIEKIEFYEKDDRTLVESNSSNSNTNAIKFEFLSDKERFNLGYKENKNLEINNSDRRLILSFNFEKRLDSGLLISPKVKIKFI